jgi:hypothetical protein
MKKKKTKNLFFTMVFFSLIIGLSFGAFAQANLRITSPLDQGKLNLTNSEFFTLNWVSDESVTQLELWVDGQAYCSMCGGGTSGSISVDSWMSPPFRTDAGMFCL